MYFETIMSFEFYVGCIDLLFCCFCVCASLQVTVKVEVKATSENSVAYFM